MTLFLKQCRKLIFLPNTVCSSERRKLASPFFPPTGTIFFYKFMRNAALKIIAFRKWALQLSRKIGMINVAARNLVNPVCTFGPERVQIPILLKVFRYPKTFYGFVQMSIFCIVNMENAGIYKEISRQQRSFTCFLSRKLHAALWCGSHSSSLSGSNLSHFLLLSITSLCLLLHFPHIAE